MVLFRTDGNSKIGTGHIMRCLSIADEVKEIGESCLFILSSDDCSRIISDRGHDVIDFKTEYSKMEPEEIFPALNKYSPAALFVDSYFVTPEYMEIVHAACKSKGSKFIYIDDRCCFPYECDTLINYNIFGNSEDYIELYSKAVLPTLMLGTSYAPLRKEFERLTRHNVADNVVNVFVSTGGADTEHLTINLLEEAYFYKKFIFHFVVGTMNIDRDLIKSMAMGKRNIVIHENVSRMKELMLSCEMAISAAGSTLYELCATGIPSITYVIADNQVPAAKTFDAKGIIKNCGDIREMGNKRLAKELIQESVKLAGDFEERKRISTLMSTVADGKGARRIVDSLLLKTY